MNSVNMIFLFSAEAYNYLNSFIWLDYTISNLTCQDIFTGYQLYDTLE